MKRRLRGHYQKNDSPRLYNAIQKYDIVNFTIECITVANTQCIADLLERNFIAKFNATNKQIGYNISNGGRGVGKHSQETKDKLSIAFKGISRGKNTDQHNQNIAAAKVGHFVSEETKQLISKKLTGRTLSDQHIDNIAKGHTGLKYDIKNPDQRNENISKGKKKKLSDAELINLMNDWKSGKFKVLQLIEKYKLSESYIREIISGRARKYG